MGRPSGHIERISVDEFIVVKQRKALCYDCGTLYIGSKEKVTCRGCRTELETLDVGASKKIPTGVWSLFLDKAQVSNCSVMGEVPRNGGG